MAYTKTQVLSVYRSLLRNSNKFDNYNFREYFLKKTKTEFRNNRSIPDNAAVMEQALNDLGVLKRQAAISDMYHSEKLVVEKTSKR